MSPELERFIHLYRSSKELLELDKRSEAFEMLTGEIRSYIERKNLDMPVIEFREMIAVKYRELREAERRGRSNELSTGA